MEKGIKEQAGRVWSGDIWGGSAAMLVALPSSIAFGVAIFSAMSAAQAGYGAYAGMMGALALGLVAPLIGGNSRLISAPSAPVAAVFTALAVGYVQQGLNADTVPLLLVMIGFLAGLIQIGLGMGGVGKLIKFIPYPVISGYLSGVGLIIISGQIPKFLGAPSGVALVDAIIHPTDWRWQSILIGAVVVVTMVLAPKFVKVVPPPIVGLVAGGGAYQLLGLVGVSPLTVEHNALLIGPLGAGDRNFLETMGHHWNALRDISASNWAQMIAPAVTLAALLSIDTLKTCLVIDTTTNTHHDPNRTLLGQGLGNIVASILGGIPGSGTMGPSMVNILSGGTTRLSGLVAGGLTLATILLLSPLIAWIPISALAAILIVVGIRMVDTHSLSFFGASTTRLDFFIIVAVILVALFGDLILASGVGVALATLLFLREQSRSSVVRVRLEGADLLTRYKHLTLDGRDSQASFADKVVVIELQGSLFFGTASQLLAALETETATRKFIILNMRRVQSLDVTATHVLEQIKDQLESKGGYLIFCDIPKDLPSGLKMKRFLKDAGIVRATEKALTFRQIDEAFEWIAAQELAILPEVNNAAGVLTVREMPMFQGQNEHVLAILEKSMEIRKTLAGKKIFKLGSEGDELMIVRSGLVKVSLPLHKKEAFHLATCYPGDIVGGIGFLDAHSHTTEALALRDTEIYVLQRSTFLELNQHHRPVAFAMIENIARNLGERLHAAATEIQALRG